MVCLDCVEKFTLTLWIPMSVHRVLDLTVGDGYEMMLLEAVKAQLESMGGDTPLVDKQINLLKSLIGELYGDT